MGGHDGMEAHDVGRRDEGRQDIGRQAGPESSPLIELRGARVTRAGATLLHPLDFRLMPGARWAVLGANGAGKTTFLRLLRGEILPDVGGERWYDFPGGADGLGGSAGPQPTVLGLRQRLALVSGDMQDLFGVHGWAASGLDVVLSGFGDGPLLYAPPEPEQVAAASALLDGLGLSGLARRRMAHVSTGEGRRLLLARALVSHPAVLVLDECLEGLDAPARQEFLALLDRVAGADPRLAVLFATHRLDELPGCLTSALIFQAGRVLRRGWLSDVASGVAPEVLAEPGLPGLSTHGAATQAVPATASASSPATDSASDSTFGPVTDYINDLATNLATGLAADLANGQAASAQCSIQGTAQSAAPEVLARITNASIDINGVRILHEISWTIRPGEHWAVLGPNGAGKSTLLALLAGQLWPSAVDGPPGLVEYGFAAPWETVDDARRRIGVVSGALQAAFPFDLRVEEAVATGLDGNLDVFSPPDAAGLARVAELLGFFELAGLAGRRLRSLSRGQQRRVLLARALAGNPALLALDEPMAGLDAKTRAAARELLDRLAALGLPLVMVTHHEADLPGCIAAGQGSRVLALRAGCVAFCGGREAHAQWKAARRTGRSSTKN